MTGTRGITSITPHGDTLGPYLKFRPPVFNVPTAGNYSDNLGMVSVAPPDRGIEASQAHNLGRHVTPAGVTPKRYPLYC